MLATGSQPWRNPATYLLLVGTLALAVSVLVPFLTGQRSARIEARATGIMQALAATVEQVRAAHPDQVPDAAEFRAAFRNHLESAQAHLQDLQEIAPLPETLLSWESKHYLFHLALAPHAQSAALRLEAAAWPKSNYGPAHAAFYAQEQLPLAYTRNLAASYHGTGAQRLLPGRGQPRQAAEGSASPAVNDYRSQEDERWLRLRPTRSTR